MKPHSTHPRRGLRRPMAVALPPPRESAVRFTPIGKRCFVEEWAAPPQHCQEGLPQRRQGKRGSFRPRQTDRASCEAFTLVVAKWEWPQPPSPPHPHESGGRATPTGALPQLTKRKGGSAAGLQRRASLVPCALRARAHLVPSVSCSLRSTSEGA